MKVGSCPDDSRLERYLYKDLPFHTALLVRLHLVLCQDCRKRLALMQGFDKMLSKVPAHEPPEGFLLDLLAAVESWDYLPGGLDPFSEPSMAEGSSAQVENTPVFRVKVRWALGTAAFAVASILQWRFGDSLPEIMRGRYLLSFADIQSVWAFLSSGEWLASMKEVIAAVRADGLASLIILGNTIPWLAAGVIVFGGVVTAMFIRGLRQPRSGGDGR